MQLCSAASVPPVIEMVVPLIFSAAPEQVVAASGGLANTSPAGTTGSVSLTAMPFRLCARFELPMVRVSIELLPMASAVGENALLIVGAISTRVLAVGGTLSLVASVVSMTALPMRAVAELV